MKSPSEYIFKLYADYERKGLSTRLINEAIDRMTYTVGKTNEEVVGEWLKECEINEVATFKYNLSNQ